jgi:hypothetical protein
MIEHFYADAFYEAVELMAKKYFFVLKIKS